MAGAIGQALAKSASNQLVNVGTGKFTFTKSTPFSGSQWIRRKAAFTGMSDYNLSVSPGWILDTLGGAIEFGIINSDESNGIDAFGATKVTDNKWHHIVFTYDGSASASGIKLYVDGALDAITTATLGTGNPGTLTDSGFVLGGDKASGFFNGSMPLALDDTRIYNRALSAAEVTQLYKLGH